MLAKTLGVDKLIIAVNKMDDHSVGWEQERYDEICGKMKPFLKSTCGFKEDQVLSILYIKILKSRIECCGCGGRVKFRHFAA